MIDAPRVVVQPDPGGLDDLGHLPGQLRIARCGVLHGEEFVREAVEVMDRSGLRHRRHGRRVHVPMGRDRQDRSRPRDPGTEGTPGLRVPVSLKRVHRAAVTQEHGRHRLCRLDSRPLLRPPRTVRSHQPGGVRGHGPAILRDTPLRRKGQGASAGTSGGHEERRLRLRDGWGPVVGLRREKTDLGDGRDRCRRGRSRRPDTALLRRQPDHCDPRRGGHPDRRRRVVDDCRDRVVLSGLPRSAAPPHWRTGGGGKAESSSRRCQHPVGAHERDASLPTIIRHRLVGARRGTAGIGRCPAPRPQCAEARLLTCPRRVRPTQLPRQHNWCIRSIRLGQVVRRTPPAMSPVQISSLRRWTFPETATVSGSTSLPYSTTTSNAMRWTQTRNPQGGEPYRSDLIPWSMSLPAVRTQRADSAWYEVIHGGPGSTVRLAATSRPSW